MEYFEIRVGSIYQTGVVMYDHYVMNIEKLKSFKKISPYIENCTKPLNILCMKNAEKFDIQLRCSHVHYLFAYFKCTHQTYLFYSHKTTASTPGTS